MFGGDIITATDIAVAASLCDIGDKQKVSHISEDLKINALNTVKKMVEIAIDQVKVYSHNFLLKLIIQNV